jgi:multiple sugar transport system ATP-binding protein
MELYETPNSVFVAGFIGSPKMNFIAGDKAASFDTHTVGIRGEHITIVPDNGTWSGTVIHTENLGADSYVYLEMGTEEPVVVRLDGPNSYKSGDTIHITPMADKVHRFDAAGKPVR